MIRIFFAATLTAAALASAPAFAKDETIERRDAIAACRAQIAEQLNVANDSHGVDFRRSQTKGRSFELRFAVKENGQSLGTASCVYTRGDAKVASVELDGALQLRAQTATAARD